MKIANIVEELQEIGKEIALYFSISTPGKQYDPNFLVGLAMQVQMLRCIEHNGVGPEMRESIRKMLIDQGYSK